MSKFQFTSGSILHFIRVKTPEYPYVLVSKPKRSIPIYWITFVCWFEYYPKHTHATPSLFANGYDFHTPILLLFRNGSSGENLLLCIGRKSQRVRKPFHRSIFRLVCFQICPENISHHLTKWKINYSTHKNSSASSTLHKYTHSREYNGHHWMPTWKINSRREQKNRCKV